MGKLVCFDFDGVIADSFHAAFSVGRKFYSDLSEDQFRKLFEKNIFNTFSASLIDFARSYTEMMRQVTIFPEMDAVVKTLASDYPLVIVSSSSSRAIEEFLSKHQLLNYFSGIFSSDVHTSKSHKLELAMRKFTVVPEKTLIITDTLGDMQEASTVGVKSIGVTWGFQNKTTLERGEPFAIAAKPQEIVTCINKFFV